MLDDLTIALKKRTAHIIAARFTLENERHRNMSRLSEKLAAAAAVAPRQAAKIEARADSIIAREQDIERQTEQSFLPHELLLDEAENGLSALEKELRLMSNNPPLEHSTPLPNGPRVLPDGQAGVGDLNLPKATTDRVALGPHPDQPEALSVANKITEGWIINMGETKEVEKPGAVYHFDERGHIINIDDDKGVEKPAAATFRAAE